MNSSLLVFNLLFSGNYDKAQRRIKRLYKKRDNVESTDSEQIVEERESSTLRTSRIPEAEVSRNKNQPRDDEAAGARASQSRTAYSDTKSEKKSALIACLTRLRGSAIGDPLKEFVMDYWDAKLDFLMYKLRDDFSNLKRCIQYDLNRKIEELKINMTMHHVAGAQPMASPIEELSTNFPIKTLEEFLDFERTLDPMHEDNLADPEKALSKRVTLKEFMSVLTHKESNYAADIKKILKELIAKEVQLNYSGVGRVVKGKGKKNFSATATFACMRGLHTKSIHGN
ncbi:uncharacterized protein LOC126765227 isoform X2 [Bactrocera neohumeralis]|uniref:uncharacterized protein LOC126765227 isoform X2 n=1 Tax=Bactrocera neohumeralis TaxID=98809 RepID=UPI0021656784|nr:uncharacterized protein LOC126765227 isoform X2 [Bactrocera neohumeralis]